MFSQLRRMCAEWLRAGQAVCAARMACAREIRASRGGWIVGARWIGERQVVLRRTQGAFRRWAKHERVRVEEAAK